MNMEMSFPKNNEELEKKIFSLREIEISLKKKLGEDDPDVIELGKTIEGIKTQWKNNQGRDVDPSLN